MQPSYQPSRYILTTSLSRPIGYFFSVYVIVDNTPLLWYSSEQKISHQNSATWSIYKIVYHIKEIFLHFTDSHNRKKCILFSLPLGKITLMRVYICFAQSCLRGFCLLSVGKALFFLFIFQLLCVLFVCNSNPFLELLPNISPPYKVQYSSIFLFIYEHNKIFFEISFVELIRLAELNFLLKVFSLKLTFPFF